MQGGGYDQGFHEIHQISPWNLVDFTFEIQQSSPRFQSMKSTQNYKSKCFSKNSSVWWMQGGGYDQGFHEIRMKSAGFHLKSAGWNPLKSGGFHEIRRISCEIERPLARNCNPMFCKFFVLPFRQKNSQLSDYTEKTRQNSYFGLKMGQKQLNFLHWLHWLLKNYLFFLMFRNLGKMQNKYYSSYLPKISKILGNKYDLTFFVCTEVESNSSWCLRWKIGPCTSEYVICQFHSTSIGRCYLPFRLLFIYPINCLFYLIFFPFFKCIYLSCLYKHLKV